MNGQSRTGRIGQFILITLFSSRCTALPPFFTSLNNVRKYVREKLFSYTKSALFVDFSLSDFNVKCHILSTGGGCSSFSIGSKSFQYWQDFPPLSMVTLLLGFLAFCTLGLEKCISKFRQVGEFHAAVSTIGYPTLSPYIQIVKVLLEDNPIGWT